ncbi:hypermethylated in cancer 2 protein-like [Brachionichthys hirsutus]|uniref:hypermethylated in cancer 2 protein-like n=1 Tax=Brachionichthys hirsutus TaxID=412623 RepID=UPI00360538F3
MEVAPYAQKAANRAESLLASLNLQREQAQFCDGVLRLRQNPGQLYLAHRCVLAASSPVLASILSSTGTLVELQVPCLSDSILRLVLDYIYRGTVPYNHSQQQYSNLLSAACYLQMDELEETLRTTGSSKGSNSHSGNLCPEREAKEEESYSTKCSVDMEKQDNQRNHCGPQHGWYSMVHRAEKSTIDTVSFQDEHDDENAAMGNATAGISLEHDNSSDSWTSEPLQNMSMPKDNVSDNMHNCMGQSYHGRLYYHYMPNDDSELPHTDPDHKHSVVSQPGHSDQSSVDEEVAAITSPGVGSLGQHFAAIDKVLLLDISGKPAELLLSDRRKSDELEKYVALNRRDEPRKEHGDNDRQQQHGKSLAKTKKRRIGPRTMQVAESSNETETNIWVSETSTEERKSNGKVESSPAADAAHKAQGWEGDDQTASWTARSSPRVPDSVETDVSSTLSVCIPSNLSASVPRNTSAHLSPPAHDPIQCSLCSRSFSQRGSLNRHMRSHLGVRPFPCPRCPMTFSRQYRVLEHMRVHQRCALSSDFQKSPTSLMCENSESSLN